MTRDARNGTATVVIGTTNRGKLNEITSILSSLSIRFVSLAEFTEVTPVIEDGDSFEANARKKAVEIAKAVGKTALADDSGLEVDALDGRPGIWSARFADPDATDADNRRLLLEMMKDVPSDRRTARFRCTVAIAGHDGWCEVFSGACEGIICHSPRGDGGFGYDPIFEPTSYIGRTFAELPTSEKNRISHRARALEEAKPFLMSLV